MSTWLLWYDEVVRCVLMHKRCMQKCKSWNYAYLASVIKTNENLAALLRRDREMHFGAQAVHAKVQELAAAETRSWELLHWRFEAQ